MKKLALLLCLGLLWGCSATKVTVPNPPPGPKRPDIGKLPASDVDKLVPRK